MRIRDWSSDVCSSDLHPPARRWRADDRPAARVGQGNAGHVRRPARDGGSRQGGKPGVSAAIAAAPRAERLPVWLKLVHGLGSIAYGVKENGFSTFLLLFYKDRKSTRLNSSH